MKIQKVLFLIIFTISLSNIAYSQGGTYIIPSGSPATTSTVDSILTYIADTNNISAPLDTDSLGALMWFSEPYDQYVSNKLKSTGFICTVNNFVKLNSQYDTALKVIDYETKTTSLDSTGSEFWTESISVSVVDSTEIIINSPANVVAKIYEAYDIINPTVTQKTVVGNGIDQSFSVNFESGKRYIIAFIKNGNSIVYITRIGV